MSRSAARTILGLGAVAAAGTLAYAAGVEPFQIEVVHSDLYLPRLPRSFEGYTIYVISDLHMRRLGRREQRVAEILTGLPPADLVAVPGDMVHTPDGILPFFELARSMRAADGIYAVYGNSEYKNGVRPRAFAGQLEEHGIVPLLNRSAMIARGGESIALAGTDDPVNWRDDVDAALEGVPDDRCVVMLMHSPESVAHAVRRGVDLVISGHTHGGQIKFPIIGAPYTHVSFGPRMSAGYYALDSLRGCIGNWPGRTQLYVTRGIGVSGLALRVMGPPEFTILTLRRGIPGRRLRSPAAS
jgi:predicted MPP superfamily phosphohydrolase